MSQARFPKVYLTIKEKHEKFISAVEELGQALKQSGPLDEKIAQLIQLAASVTIRSEGAVHSHVKRALEAGATYEEIYHTLILLTSTIGFPTVAASFSWVSDLQEGN